MLEKVREHYPMVVERIDESEFTLWSGRDILQGALTPVVRQDYARLDTGRTRSPSATPTASSTR